jgi:3',5'-cyclic AMP phosphodiesterase CpdA
MHRAHRLLIASAFIVACGSPAEPIDAGSDTPFVPRDAGPALGLPALDCSSDNCWTFAVLSDPHIIDAWYEGPESNALDTESILMANDRLGRAQARINELATSESIELAVVAGDLVHDFPFDTVDDYVTGPDADVTAVALAQALFEGFSMPVHPTLGNHDYEQPRISRETTHAIFGAVMGIEPYYAVNHRGLRILMLNSQLGETWNPDSEAYDEEFGSLGAEQMAWLEAQLEEAIPTVLVLHHHPIVVARGELPGAVHPDLFAIMESYSDVIRLVISGHAHRWLDFARRFGALQVTVGSTRYDEDAFLLFRVDEVNGDLELINPETPVWASTEANPYLP